MPDDKITQTEPKRWGNYLYELAEPRAHAAKVVLQMLIGAGTVCVLGYDAINLLGIPAPQSLRDAAPLEIIARGLEYAAGVELAYMLFTDGPDEAIQPLILGLSAATLLTISGTASVVTIIAAPAYVLTISLLLWLKTIYFSGKENADEDSQAESRSNTDIGTHHG